MYTKETHDNQCFISLENGTCGMNQKAIAQLSGISEFKLTRLIQKAISTKSSNPFLQILYCASESSYLVDLPFFNHKIWKSEYAYNVICYAATELKNDVAIETLTRLGQIGLRTFIQDLTGFQLHKGSDADLKTLHDILGIKEEMLRRTDHKIANLEYFRDNISNIWKLLFEFRGGVSYYKDLSVLPPQVQRNAFKAINLLKELFRSIQRLRNDFEVASLDQLSKDRIAIVSKTLPSVLRSTMVLPGEGLLIKEWQWDNLFSLDFHTLYDETKVSEDKDGVSTFGRRKDITKLAIMIAQENRAVLEEEILSTIVKKSLKQFITKPQIVSDFYDTAYANNVSEDIVINRVKQSLPDIAEEFTKAFTGCKESKSILVSLSRNLQQLEEDLLDTTDCRLIFVYESANAIQRTFERIFGSERFNGHYALEDETHLYVFKDKLSHTQFKREHFFYPQLFDFIHNWEHNIVPRLEKEIGLPWSNKLKMSSLDGFNHKGYLDGISNYNEVLDVHYSFKEGHGLTEDDFITPTMTIR